MPAIHCDQLFQGVSAPHATGGQPPYWYQLGQAPWLPEHLWHQDITPGTTHTLTIKDANGCTNTSNWTMPAIYPQGMAHLPASTTVLPGEDFLVTWTPYLPNNLIASIQWAPASLLSCTDCTNPIANTLATDTIHLLLTDIFGCSQQLSMLLPVSNDLQLFIPNAFSPNGDHINDTWHIYGSPHQIHSILQLTVWDRWGGIVFQANDWPINSERHGWNGMARNQPLDPGVFVYMIELKLTNGSRVTHSGNVLLIR
ncbi:MAG: gliding motility-associated C-terminal domain-containing protein [Saprospiraceae bacterium]